MNKGAPIRAKTLNDAGSMTTEHNEEGKKNFWEPGNYSLALRRVECSSKLASDFEEMFTEYANLEAKFGKMVCNWAEKWEKSFRIQNETFEPDCYLYGTTKEAVAKFISASHEQGKSHIDNWSRVHAECVKKFTDFQSTYIHKNFNTIREIKDLKEDFATAQAPYIENYDKLKNATVKFKSFVSTNKAAFGTDNVNDILSTTPDSKKTKKLATYKKRYEERREQLQLLTPRYVQKMKEIFARCDDLEKSKLFTIKEAFEGFSRVTSFISSNNRNQFIINQNEAINELDVDKDLQWWYDCYGPGCKYEYDAIPENKSVRRKTLFGIPQRSKDPEARMSCNTNESPDDSQILNKLSIDEKSLSKE